MPPATYEWDESNLDHVSLHGVGPDEAEAVLDNGPLLLRTGDRKYLAYGQTDNGRYLLVVFVRKPDPSVRIITARDLTDAEKQQYRRRRR